MTQKETVRRILQVIRVYRIQVVLSLILAAVSVFLSLYIPILFGDMIDCIVSPQHVNWSLMGINGRRIFVLIIGYAVSTWTMNVINNHIAYQVVKDMRDQVMEKIQCLPLSYLDQRETGDLVQRVIGDIDQISDGLLLGFTQLFTGVLTIFATLVFMLVKSVLITIFVVVCTPLSFAVARFIASRSYRMFRLQTQTRGRQTGLIDEMIGHQKVVQAFDHQDRASAAFASLNDELHAYSWRAVFYSSLTNPCTRFVNGIIYAGVLVFGARQILAHALTIGGLSVLLNYSNQYMKPFNDISSVISELQNALACAARVFELLDARPESTDPAAELSDVKGDIAVCDVNFSYDRNKPLLRHINVHANAGRKIALVGPTGCGKTTLINLLMRFYDVDAGSIRIDGMDIRDVSRASLRRSFGMVLQETWIRQGTVRENITLGKPDAADEEIYAAARAAHSYEFIRRLPDGLDTVLYADSLSQGQKQLLCITRVMLVHPPMLILDEATSSIDTRTEVLVQKAFDALMKGRTAFVVAHRLSTIQNADWILVMKDGQIIEQGTHASLLAEHGFYAQLYNSQFQA
jgi:ATP-binding cassette subfamily B multidrug efflux pump